MKRGRFYDPPFLLKMILLVCLVLIGLAHRKGWMTRTMGDKAHHSAAMGVPTAYELKPTR